MTEVGAFLVVMEPYLHPEQVEHTIAAVRAIRGVAGVRTIFDEVGAEIANIRGIRAEARMSADALRLVGGA